jgi:phosphoglycerol transferase
LIGRFLYRTHPQAPSQLQDGLAMLTLACLFLCTIGGFGSLFSLLITPMIRGYNRISVYIAFFSLFTIGLMIDRRCARASRFGRALLSGLIIPVLLIGGIWDQTTGQFVPSYTWVRQEFTSDAIFIRDIEALLPENAMVFQLPYAWFPEQGPICQMTDYDHLRGYLHSSRLRWSYGAYKGRPGDAWLKEVSSKPVEELVRRITEAGFGGIYIDRSAFPDAGKELEGKLSVILQIQPLVSPNRILAFYPLPVSGLHLYSQIQFDK